MLEPQRSMARTIRGNNFTLNLFSVSEVSCFSHFPLKSDKISCPPNVIHDLEMTTLRHVSGNQYVTIINRGENIIYLTCKYLKVSPLVFHTNITAIIF